MIFNTISYGSIGTTAQSGGFPEFTYTGQYSLLDDGKVGNVQNWRIKFMTSGVLTFTKIKGAIDVFLVGGGGNGDQVSGYRGGGGGGGYTLTEHSIQLLKQTNYTITIGGSAGNTVAFGYTANGGKNAQGSVGGNGGSGGGAYGSGNGGSDGSDGQTKAQYRGGTGQHTTTREFGEATGDLYAGGGGGGSTTSGQGGLGGAGGGGGIDQDGTPNTGGGGSGGFYSGGSGIVIIRNHREAVS